MFKNIMDEFSTAFKKELLKDHQRHVGIVYTCAAWFLIAFSSIFFDQTTGTHSIVNSCFHHYLAAFMTISVWVAFKNKKTVFCKNPFLLLINSLLCMLCYYISFLFKMSPAHISNSYLLNLDPILTALALVVIFKKSIPKVVWFALVLGFLGVMSFFLFDVDFTTSRALMQALACIISASLLVALVLLTKYLLKTNAPVTIALSHSLVGLCASGLFLYFSGWQMPTKFDLFCMGADGVIYAVALYFFINALNYTEIYIYTAMSYLFPVFLILINVGLRRAALDLYSLLGIGLIGASVLIAPIPAYLKDRKKVHSPTVQ